MTRASGTVETFPHAVSLTLSELTGNCIPSHPTFAVTTTCKSEFESEF
jgi:hypothetical protein